MRARSLYNAGIRTLDHVVESPEKRLASVHGIGDVLAERIKRAAVEAYKG